MKTVSIMKIKMAMMMMNDDSEIDEDDGNYVICFRMTIMCS